MLQEHSLNKMKCTKCRKEKDEIDFKGKNNKITKQCSDCRDKCKQWRGKNKKRVQLYNKFTNNKNKKDKIQVVYAKLINDEHDKWIRFVSQSQAALELNVHRANICKVLKGHAHQTGGYVFKIVEENVEENEKNLGINIKYLKIIFMKNILKEKILMKKYEK